jgi:hypothetical protein
MGEKEYRTSLPKLKYALEHEIKDVYDLDIPCNYEGIVIELLDGRKLFIPDKSDWE